MGIPATAATRLLLVEELERHSPVHRGRPGAKRRREQRRFDQLFSARAGRLRRTDMRLDAIWALCRTGHRHADQLTILPGDGAVVSSNYLVQVRPSLVVARR